MYVRRVFEYGCVLYSGTPAYKVRLVIPLEREALKLLPKFVANNVLYLEASLPSLLYRFRIPTMQTFLKFCECAKSKYYFYPPDRDIFFSLALVADFTGGIRTITRWSIRC